MDGVITIFDTTTGKQITVFSGHTDKVNILTFSLDGRSLVSGSNDMTVKLWDMQTGGIVRTFAHSGAVWSVSISPSFTIASGSSDGLIQLWDGQTGECHHTIRQQSHVQHVSFPPIDPQHLLSVSSSKVWRWDINGHQVGHTFDSYYTAFSPDGTLLAACNKTAIIVQNFNSGAIIAELHVANHNARCCCFSPDNRLIAVAAGNNAYIWIVSSEPCLIETFIGHTRGIRSLAFSSPSSLISLSRDNSVKFWQIGTPSIDLVMADPGSTPLASAESKVITLQPKDRITTTSGTNGVVKIWDISTGLCKGFFQIPAKNICQKDSQLINGRLILVWCTDKKINIWDTKKGELLFAVDGMQLEDIKISGDGSRVFSLDPFSIQAWSIQTGDFAGRVEINYSSEIGSLTVDGSRVWAYHTGSGYQGWDFGAPGSSAIQLLDVPPDRIDLNSLWDTDSSEIKNKVTEKVIFQVPKRYGKPVDMQWNGQYLVVCFEPAEIFILDFSHVYAP